MKKKKNHDSGCTRLQPTCIMSIYWQLMYWSFEIYYTECMTVQVCYWIRVNWKLVRSFPVMIVFLKQHSINHKVNYNVVKSKSEKFEAKCAVQDSTCSWKIMASVRKKTSLWEIKKYKDPYTCIAGVSQDHPKWIRWCQVPERYIPGCITGLETVPVYYNDRLLHGCQVFKRLFWSFKQCRDAFVYCKPLVQIDGTFMYGRYINLFWQDFDRPNQGIIGRQNRVHLRNRTCNCGTFDALRYPCAHAIATCQNLRILTGPK
ncbi:hypothetical protein GOBAR_AA30504 [Gossypium barbadense]|uniref:SWIM-type domain-containing protein n=1 Tax=Gossypium barbadense TaxID=3634 RepID=A0A2P5WGG5_GOSBA|nr:hypothetical protein GOBAR_AA30504 [Gossypium barbadense]